MVPPPRKRSCTNEDAYIVGAGNSAGQAAMYLSRFAKHVTMIVRGESLAKTMSQYLIDQIARNSEHNGAVSLTRAEAKATAGSTKSPSPMTKPAKLRAFRRLRCSSSLAPCLIPARLRLIECDEHGFILSGPDLTIHGRRPRNWTLQRDPSCSRRMFRESLWPAMFATARSSVLRLP